MLKQDDDVAVYEDLSGEVRFSKHLPQPNSLNRWFLHWQTYRKLLIHDIYYPWLTLTGVLQSAVGENGEVAAVDVKVVPSEERQRSRGHTQRLLLPAGAHTATQGHFTDSSISFVVIISLISWLTDSMHRAGVSLSLSWFTSWTWCLLRSWRTRCQTMRLWRICS